MAVALVIQQPSLWIRLNPVQAYLANRQPNRMTHRWDYEIKRVYGSNLTEDAQQGEKTPGHRLNLPQAARPGESAPIPALAVDIPSPWSMEREKITTSLSIDLFPYRYLWKGALVEGSYPTPIRKERIAIGISQRMTRHYSQSSLSRLVRVFRVDQGRIVPISIWSKKNITTRWGNDKPTVGESNSPIFERSTTATIDLGMASYPVVKPQWMTEVLKTTETFFFQLLQKKRQRLNIQKNLHKLSRQLKISVKQPIRCLLQECLRRTVECSPQIDISTFRGIQVYRGFSVNHGPDQQPGLHVYQGIHIYRVGQVPLGFLKKRHQWDMKQDRPGRSWLAKDDSDGTQSTYLSWLGKREKEVLRLNKNGLKQNVMAISAQLVSIQRPYLWATTDAHPVKVASTFTQLSERAVTQRGAYERIGVSNEYFIADAKQTYPHPRSLRKPSLAEVSFPEPIMGERTATAISHRVTWQAFYVSQSRLIRVFNAKQRRVVYTSTQRNKNPIVHWPSEKSLIDKRNIQIIEHSTSAKIQLPMANLPALKLGRTVDVLKAAELNILWMIQSNRSRWDSETTVRRLSSFRKMIENQPMGNYPKKKPQWMVKRSPKTESLNYPEIYIHQGYSIHREIGIHERVHIHQGDRVHQGLPGKNNRWDIEYEGVHGIQRWDKGKKISYPSSNSFVVARPGEEKSKYSSTLIKLKHFPSTHSKLSSVFRVDQRRIIPASVQRKQNSTLAWATETDILPILTIKNIRWDLEKTVHRLSFPREMHANQSMGNSPKTSLGEGYRWNLKWDKQRLSWTAEVYVDQKQTPRLHKISKEQKEALRITLEASSKSILSKTIQMVMLTIQGPHNWTTTDNHSSKAVSADTQTSKRVAIQRRDNGIKEGRRSVSSAAGTAGLFSMVPFWYPKSLWRTASAEDSYSNLMREKEDDAGRTEKAACVFNTEHRQVISVDVHRKKNLIMGWMIENPAVNERESHAIEPGSTPQTNTVLVIRKKHRGSDLEKATHRLLRFWKSPISHRMETLPKENPQGTVERSPKTEKFIPREVSIHRGLSLHQGLRLHREISIHQAVQAKQGLPANQYQWDLSWDEREISSLEKGYVGQKRTTPIHMVSNDKVSKRQKEAFRITIQEQNQRISTKTSQPVTMGIHWPLILITTNVRSLEAVSVNRKTLKRDRTQRQDNRIEGGYARSNTIAGSQLANSQRREGKPNYGLLSTIAAKTERKEILPSSAAVNLSLWNRVTEKPDVPISIFQFSHQRLLGRTPATEEPDPQSHPIMSQKASEKAAIGVSEGAILLNNYSTPSSSLRLFSSVQRTAILTSVQPKMKQNIGWSIEKTAVNARDGHVIEKRFTAKVQFTKAITTMVRPQWAVKASKITGTFIHQVLRKNQEEQARGESKNTINRLMQVLETKVPETRVLDTQVDTQMLELKAYGGEIRIIESRKAGPNRGLSTPASSQRREQEKNRLAHRSNLAKLTKKSAEKHIHIKGLYLPIGILNPVGKPLREHLRILYPPKSEREQEPKPGRGLAFIRESAKPIDQPIRAMVLSDLTPRWTQPAERKSQAEPLAPVPSRRVNDEFTTLDQAAKVHHQTDQSYLSSVNLEFRKKEPMDNPQTVQQISQQKPLPAVPVEEPASRKGRKSPTNGNGTEINIQRITDLVFAEIEKRWRTAKQRRGM
ncbi:hypothetical protein GJ688_15410 [Heliobacillus mobilis]|uniref:Uncharacterized protein n=1 Tax=Heliobacterium mobile TaxID=28064 RepID=A0A6I3SQ96_HELMO|nr:hypothetical protein [Heliobacterium mobile]